MPSAPKSNSRTLAARDVEFLHNDFLGAAAGGRESRRVRLDGV
jgi:hypothetical protein